MNWKNNENTDFWRKYIVNELLVLHCRLSNHEHGPYGCSVSREDAESEDFQRFLTVLQTVADSQSALEFKMNCEMFGRDPKDDFEFCLRFALDVFANEFEIDCDTVPTESNLKSYHTSVVVTNRILRSAENFEYEEFFEIRAAEKKEKEKDV